LAGQAIRETGVVTLTRLLTLDDAPALAELLTRDRAFMAPYEPERAEDYYTVDGQRALLTSLLDAHERGVTLPQAILEDGRVVGRITLNEIVRGPLQSCSMGYWVNQADNGKGLATDAVRETLAYAFGELGLHRVQAGTLVDNVRSQRVLEHNGFVQFGLAPQYLRIAGRWQDHLLFQKLNPAD
jgi:ribosomal-protein-alanine N-acetyltransferase